MRYLVPDFLEKLRLDFVAAAFTVRDGFLIPSDLPATRTEKIVMPKKVIWLEQVHSNTIFTIGNLPDVDKYIGKEADGLITNLRSVALSVHTADCAPVALIDTQGRAIALLHAGWRGANSGIIMNGVFQMLSLGILPKDIFAYIGPTISANDYEVGEEFFQKFPKSTVKRGDRILFDLPGEIERQLIELRITNIEKFPLSTFSNPWLHSNRRDGDQAGRIEFFLWLK